MPTLFCFDFEGTLTQQSIHGEIAAAGYPGWQAQEATRDASLVADIRHLTAQLLDRLYDPVATGQFMQAALNQGHTIAVATFSDHPEMVEVALQHLLPGMDLSCIPIAAFLPIYPASGEPTPGPRVWCRSRGYQMFDHHGKNGHIDYILAQMPSQKVAALQAGVLIDDSRANCAQVANLRPKLRPELSVDSCWVTHGIPYLALAQRYGVAC